MFCMPAVQQRALRGVHRQPAKTAPSGNKRTVLPKGGMHMKRIDCLFERSASIGIAVALVLMAVGLSVIGITVLPVLGLFLAIPVFLMAGFFLFSPRSKECTIN